MSKNERSTLPKAPAGQTRNGTERRKSDLRIRRTRGRLSDALVVLMLEKPLDKIAVQEVLDRASVGRSTFYLHYRDKDDLLLCVLEDGLEMWTTALTRNQEKSYRIAPERHWTNFSTEWCGTDCNPNSNYSRHNKNWCGASLSQ